MGQQKPSRPRPAKRRTLPPDAKTIEQVLRVVHADVLSKVTHLKHTPHDGLSRRALQTLFSQRSGAWQKLLDIHPGRALQLAAELGLSHSGGIEIPILEDRHAVVEDKPAS